MDNIPVEYYYEDIKCNGTLTKVSGSGSSATYHLMVDGFYRGQLVHTDDHGWQFTSNDQDFSYTMAKWFQKYIELMVE